MGLFGTPASGFDKKAVLDWTAQATKLACEPSVNMNRRFDERLLTLSTSRI